jgi:chromosome segregation ATPase
VVPVHEHRRAIRVQVHRRNSDVVYHGNAMDASWIHITQDAMATRVEDLQCTASELGRKVATQEQTVEGLEQKVQSLEGLEQKVQGLEGLEQKVQALEQIVFMLNRKLDGLEPAVRKLEPTVRKLEPTVEKLEPTVENLKSTVEKLEQTVETLNERMADASDASDKMLKVIQTMTREVAELKFSVCALHNSPRTSFGAQLSRQVNMAIRQHIPCPFIPACMTDPD